MPVLLPTRKLQEQCDPYKVHPWQFWEKLTRKQVTEAIKTKSFLEIPYSGINDSKRWTPDDRDPDRGLDGWESHDEHIQRIAYLVVHGWADPIVLDVGVPSLRCYVDWPVLDGNHRVAAAIYRKDPTILASVSGSVDHAFELFGVDIREKYTSTP